MGDDGDRAKSQMGNERLDIPNWILNKQQRGILNWLQNDKILSYKTILDVGD